MALRASAAVSLNRPLPVSRQSFSFCREEDSLSMPTASASTSANACSLRLYVWRSLSSCGA